MIRFISIAVLLFCFLVPGYPLLAAQNSLGMKDPAARDRESLKIVQFMFRLILKIAGVEVTVKGAENIHIDRDLVQIGIIFGSGVGSSADKVTEIA